MTPDQAAQLIREAWGPFTGDDFSLSNRIALALDAIGLLAFACDPQAGLQPGPQAGARQLPDATLRPLPTKPNEPAKASLSDWASNRTRT